MFAQDLWWGLPFVGLLLSFALIPQIAPWLWRYHGAGFAVFFALAFLFPCAWRFGCLFTLEQLSNVFVLEYFPFLSLIGSLYIVVGGLDVTGSVRATPLRNTAILAFGTVLAGVIGTTGATMLLIRPLLRANRKRRHRAHVVVFFIILVGNVGGALSPLGDPPLFLGYLLGVDFFWPLRHLLAPVALISVPLLAVFYFLDREWGHNAPAVAEPTEPLRLAGKGNLILLFVIILAVMGQDFLGIIANIVMISAAVVSLGLTPMAKRRETEFVWAPLWEVAILFAAIFVTIIPVFALLQAGPDGAASSLFRALTFHAQSNPKAFFWLTGLFSSVLDNAPTYLIFFTAAGGDAAALSATNSEVLTAISAGAVFMGANTYIGNAPNILVRSIAMGEGVVMPGFFTYIFWVGLMLLPLYSLLTAVFFPVIGIY